MNRPVHHVGYVVEDLEAAIDRFVRTQGVGPFFVIEHVPFDEVTYTGEPAVYDHSSAFGGWGPITVELTEVHAVEPAGLADALVKPGGGVGHVAWVVDSIEEESANLEPAGIRPFHTGRIGPVYGVWFHGGPLFGHPIEVLQRSEELLGFHEMARAAGENWDGRDPIRRVE